MENLQVKSKSEKKYTLSGLAKYLNETVNTKKSGRKFTPQDIQQYCLRGHLPKYLGGAVLKVCNTDTGIKFIQIYGEIIESL